MSNKTKILKISLDLFKQYGYQKTKLSDIAKSMGKVKSAIYYYFSGKEEIFEELVKQEAESFIEEIISQVSKQSSATKQLEKYIETRILLMNDLSNRYDFLKKDFFELFPLIDKYRSESDKKEMELLNTILSLGMTNNEFSCDNQKEKTKFLFKIIKGMEIQLFVTNNQSANKEDINIIKNLLINGTIKPIA